MAKTKEIKADIQHVRAEIVPNSFKKENRTIEIVFATETPVRTYNYNIGPYREILDMNPKSIRAERSGNGLPVFDSHYPRTAMVQLGIAENIEFKNKEAKATIRLGARADDALISDLENGILKGISVGYNVYKLLLEKEVEGELPIYRAIDWEPLEISFAPVQADFNSSVRNENADHIIVIDNYSQKTNVKMTIAEVRAKASNEQIARLDAIVLIAKAAGISEERAIELYESEKTLEVIRSENPAKQGVPTPQVDVAKIRQEASAEERTRLDGILKSTRAAKLEDSYAIELYLSDKSIEDCRQAIIDKFVAGDTKFNGNHNAGVGKEAIEKKREAAENALLHRIVPSKFKLDGQNEFRGLSLIEMVREFAQENGVSLRGFDRMQIADMVFGKRTHGTSDFPLLLENVAAKLLRADYAQAPEYWNMIAKETSVQDFKDKSMYQVDAVNGMKEIQEGGEIKYTTLVEGKQTIRVKSFAEGIKFTRQAFINDDMNAFGLIPNVFVRDWNTLRGDIVWGLIIENGNMADGKKFFSADHKNIQTQALSDAGLEAADLLFSQQTGLDGKRRIRVAPRFLIVSNELKITAKKLMTAIAATKTGDVNVFNGAFEPIVEPRLSGKDWYLAADPNMIDGIYYCYLNGNSGLRSNREEDFDSDSIKFAVRGEFGAQAIDYRGWLKSNDKVQG